MNEFYPPLADIDSLIPFLIMVIFFAVGAISQALNKARQAQQPPPPVRPSPMARPPQPSRPPQPAPTTQPALPHERRAGPLAQEIDEFLRRAGQGRPAPPATAPPRPIPAQVVEREAAPREALAEHHLRPLERRLAPSELGKGVAVAENRLEQHFHQVFEHRVGTLTSGEFAADAPQAEAPQPAAADPAPASDLVALLSTPGGLRQAILLNEILQRPLDRWE